MKQNDLMYCIEAIAFIQGSSDLSGKAEQKALYMRKILWRELENVLRDQEPQEEAAAPKQEEPKKEEAVEQKDDSVLVKDRKECRKCPYLLNVAGNGDPICQYILKTGKARGCSVAECEHWKDQKSKRNFNHVFLHCGKEFTDNAPRTKVCPECKAVSEP